MFSAALDTGWKLLTPGAAGLQRAVQQRFDLVFCDINLPDIDGLSVLPQLLQSDEPPTVIMITAFPSVETAVRGMKIGARDYVTKPFTPDELRMVCSRALAEDALRGEKRRPAPRTGQPHRAIGQRACPARNGRQSGRL